MATYRLRSLARKDLEFIWDYTLQQWGINQAERYFAALFDCFEDLTRNPNIGKPRDDVLPGTRSFPQGRHVIFYELDHAGIEILGIVHQSADIERHFEP
jgi:toxin ParE1/3/4